METNFRYIATPVGLMKIIHLIFGAICLGCVAATFEAEEIRDRYFLGAVVACFVISLIYLIVHLVSYGIAINLINKAVDEVYHFIGAVLLIVGASLFLHLGVTFNQKYCQDIPVTLDPNPELCGGWYHTKVTAGAFGLINGIFYIVALVLRGIERTDYDDEDYEETPNYKSPKT